MKAITAKIVEIRPLPMSESAPFETIRLNIKITAGPQQFIDRDFWLRIPLQDLMMKLPIGSAELLNEKLSKFIGAH